MRIRDLLGVVVATPTMFACSQLPPEMRMVHDVAEALGGADTIVDAETLVVEGEGRQYRLGQNHTPDDELTYWTIDEYRRDVDLPGERWRVVETRTSRFLTGNPVFEEPLTFGLDGEVAYTVSAGGEARRESASVARDRRQEHFHHPVTLVRLALDETSTVSNLRQEEGQDVVDITSAEGDVYTLYADPETRHPSRIVSAGYHPVLGDVTLTTEFVNYRETGGLGGFRARLTVPRQIISMIDDLPTQELLVTTDYDVDDVALADLAAPESARASTPPEFQASIEVAEVADGVWHVRGQSHHSVVVEFDEFLTVIEAPQNEARTLAVLEAVRELQPDKPIRFVVNTHHHFDHSGGVRAAVSEGLTVVTHELHEAFVRDLVARSHASNPDVLALNPAELTMELVRGDDVYEIENGRRTMQIARLTDNSHCDGLLAVYLPRERLLIEADAFTPGSLEVPFAANLLQVVNDREWRVERIVPIHGDVVDLAVLEEAVETGGSDSSAE